MSSLDCESRQFARHHRRSLNLRVNKRASFPFELVMFGVLVQFHLKLDLKILFLWLMIIHVLLGYII